MKREVQEVYLENPGVECELEVLLSASKQVILQTIFSNVSKEDIFLAESLVPNGKLSNQIFSVRDIENETYLPYLGKNIAAGYNFENDVKFRVRAGYRIHFKFRLDSYFPLVNGREYEIRYSEFMPLIKNDSSGIEKEGHIPIFYRLRSNIYTFRFI